jgi:hypothetical protein
MPALRARRGSGLGGPVAGARWALREQLIAFEVLADEL